MPQGNYNKSATRDFFEGGLVGGEELVVRGDGIWRWTSWNGRISKGIRMTEAR